MARSRATIRFRDGTQAVFNRAEQFQHGCGAFVVLYVQDKQGRSRELAFAENDVASTTIEETQEPIGFKRR